MSLAGRMIAPPRALWPPFGRLALGAAIAISGVAAVMFLLDPLVAARARNLPHGLIVVFQVITDFGRSGWFLIPSGVLLAVVAACASRARGRTTYLVLMSLAVRLGFVFLAIGLPSLFASILKRLIGRARPLRVDGVHRAAPRPGSMLPLVVDDARSDAA